MDIKVKSDCQGYPQVRGLDLTREPLSGPPAQVMLIGYRGPWQYFVLPCGGAEVVNRQINTQQYFAPGTWDVIPARGNCDRSGQEITPKQ